MPDTYALYRRAATRPLGKRAFSLLFANKAPYFRTVRPQVRDVRPHHAELTIRKRRAVQNHIGTVHAIAVCNGLEAAMGLLAEATTPPGPALDPQGDAGVLPREVDDRPAVRRRDRSGRLGRRRRRPRAGRAVRTDGTVVVDGIITIYVSEKPAR